MTTLLEQARKAGEIERHDEATSGDFLIAAGKTPARLIGYIELGLQDQGEYQGTAKKPAVDVQLVFECFGSNARDVDVDGKKVKAGSIFRPYSMAKTLTDRSNFYKLFKKMNNGRDHGNMAEMLNEVFILDIEHAETAKKRKYAKIKELSSPIIEEFDEMGTVTGTRDISAKVPAAHSPFQLFLLKEPTIEQWDSIHIEGTYKRKVKAEDGTESEVDVAKNFMQEKLQSALDWEGSPMQALLLNSTIAEDVPVKKDAPVEKSTTATEKASGTSASNAAPSEEVKPEPKQEEAKPAGDDLLDELGL